MNAPINPSELGPGHKEWGSSQPIVESEEGRAYRRFMMRLRSALKRSKSDDELAEALEEANDWALELRNHTYKAPPLDEVSRKEVRPGDVHTDELLTNMSIMYANDEFIGTRLVPIVFTGGKLSGLYATYDKRDRLAAPDDTMLDKTDPVEVSQNRAKSSFSLTMRALREYVDQMTIQNQDATYSELVDATEHVLYLMELLREQRIASLMTTAANYGANTIALAAGDRWDTASGGNPGAVVDAAKAAIWPGNGPGRMVMFTSLDVHNALKRNPAILDQFKYTGGRPGFATRDMLREYFEVDEYLVGKAWNDTANKGQTAAYARIWTNVLGVVRVAERPSLRNAAFGYTLQDLPTESRQWFEQAKGPKGGYICQSARADTHIITAADTGYLVTTPIG